MMIVVICCRDGGDSLAIASLHSQMGLAYGSLRIFMLWTGDEQMWTSRYDNLKMYIEAEEAYHKAIAMATRCAPADPMLPRVRMRLANVYGTPI